MAPTTETDFASRGDLARVEHKVEGLVMGLERLASAVMELNKSLAVREAVEKQGQILKAELDAGSLALKMEKDKNSEAWTALKTKCLWVAMVFLFAGSYPNILSMVRQIKGLIP